MKCSFCKGDKFTTLYKAKEWQIKRCFNCKLVTTLINKTTNYNKYHRDTQYQKEEKLFENIFQKRYQVLSKYFNKPGKVLDVGASTGTMLDIFKSNGWETHGVEPSASYKIAQDKGHKIFHSSFEKASIQKNSFDLIIINHTLEHVVNPSVVIAKIKQVLKQGGYVYIDVPNFDSLSRVIAGEHWKYLLPREHVHHFEPDTLKQIVKSENFNLTKITTWSGIFDVSDPVSLLWYKFSHFKKSLFTDLLGIPGNIIATLLNRGTNLVLIAQK